jgi:hypothetical protein
MATELRLYSGAFGPCEVANLRTAFVPGGIVGKTKLQISETAEGSGEAEEKGGEASEKGSSNWRTTER